MIKALLIDVDGVLVTSGMFSTPLEQKYGISQAATADFFKEVFPATIIGQADLKKILPPYLKTWGWPGSVDDFLTFWFEAEKKVDKELVEYLQKLRREGIKCYVATNQEKYRTAYLLEKMQFDTLFDGLFVSCELGVRKPDISFYASIHKSLEPINKTDILFWDDSKSHVEAAELFGIGAEWYSSFSDFKSKMEQYV